MFITRFPREMNIRLRKVFENGLRIVQWAAIVRRTMLSTLSNLSHVRHVIRRRKRGQVCLLLLIRWYTLSPLKLSFIENAYIAASIRRYPIHAANDIDSLTFAYQTTKPVFSVTKNIAVIKMLLTLIV